MDSPLITTPPVPPRRTGPKLQAVVRNVTKAEVVEFDFIYGDPDLTVELVLPRTAFREFCVENHCLVTAADPADSRAVLRLVKDDPVLALDPAGEQQ